MDSPLVVHPTDVTKTFPGVVALDRVTLVVPGSEVRVLAGDGEAVGPAKPLLELTRLLVRVGCPNSALATGDGDPSASSSYTMTAITAVVLGGASIFGGRGSFVGALLGAVLLTEVVSAGPFLQIALSWNYWFPGILILVGAGIYSRARGGRAALIGAGGAQ